MFIFCKMVNIEVGKKDVAWFSVLLVLVSVGFVYSYGGVNPAVMGHSWQEIEFDNDFCQMVTGNDCAVGFVSDAGETCVASYVAVDGPGYTTLPARDSGWCTLGTQSYVKHYLSNTYLNINCQENGIVGPSGECCGIDTGFCSGDRISSSGIGAVATTRDCIASYYAVDGPGYTTLPARDSTWCTLGTQVYVTHWVDDSGYFYINCAEDGLLNTAGQCCGVDTGYCTGDNIGLGA